MARDRYSMQGEIYDKALADWEEHAPGDWRHGGRSGPEDGVEAFPDTIELERLANARMPYGKYAGRLLIDLPEPYLVWFSRNGFPEGETGRLLASLYVVKENGMEPFLRPLVRDERR